jgi:hypothetical protein
MAVTPGADAVGEFPVGQDDRRHQSKEDEQ